MSKFYNPNRKRNVYNPDDAEPYKISRSKLELFLNCPRCFYNDRRLGVGQPPGFPFTLNSAVDALLKKEFDKYRTAKDPHPIILENGIEAIPFAHEKLDEWRDALRGGIQYHHTKTNLIITGGVDDVWVNPQGELIIVDYKATAKSESPTLDADWQISYKRQMDIYSWLFKKNDFKVAKVGYFLYCNGLLDRESFEKKLHFDISLLPYEIDDSWVEKTILEAHKCLNAPKLPGPSEDCDYCRYFLARIKVDPVK